MLQHHLIPDDDLASRTHAFIDASVAWLRERLGLVLEELLGDVTGARCDAASETFAVIARAAS